MPYHRAHTLGEDWQSVEGAPALNLPTNVACSIVKNAVLHRQLRSNMWKTIVASFVVWIVDIALMGGGTYSISLMGPSGFNTAIVVFGLAQVVLTLKWRHAALKIVGGELLFSQLLLLGYFFAPPESNTPNVDLPILWMIVIYSMSALVMLLLAKVCLDEGGRSAQQR